MGFRRSREEYILSPNFLCSAHPSMNGFFMEILSQIRKLKRQREDMEKQFKKTVRLSFSLQFRSFFEVFVQSYSNSIIFNYIVRFKEMCEFYSDSSRRQPKRTLLFTLSPWYFPLIHNLFFSVESNAR